MRKIYLAFFLLATGMFLAGEAFAQPSITYTPVSGSCAGSDVVVSGVSISDATGVPTTGSNMPRVYFKKNSGAWFSAAGTLTSGTGTSGTWSFTISAATLGGLTSGNTLSYYIIAQNTGGTVASNPSAGLSATDVNTVATAPTSPNSYTVNSVPSLSSLSSSASTTCVGTPITFSAGATSGTGSLVSYTWSGPNSFSTTGTTPSVMMTPTTTAATGVYSLYATYPGQGCVSATRTTAVTVNGPLPTIGGTLAVCESSTTTLTNSTTGGVWSSGNTGIATIHPSSGLVTGVASGTVDITYHVGTCITSSVVTVNPLPLPISGTYGLCIGDVSTLSSLTGGGTWSSTNTSIVTVGSSSGVITGIASGSSTISYTLSTGCARTVVATVHPFPATFSGTSTVCEGSTTTLSSSPTAGTWTSSDITKATVSSSGVVTGVASGTSTITYTVSTGCYRTGDVTVNPLPAAITGATTICSGFSTTLSDATSGGTWSSSSLAVASIDFSTGVLTGVSSGVANISYTLGTGCRAVLSVTGNITPHTITGTMAVCESATSTLSSSTSGGTWSSSVPAVATIGMSSGFVSANTAGTTTISYTGSNGCYRTATFTVNPVPAAISGTLTVCDGSTTTLTNATAGGTWQASSASVATIGSLSGDVFGVNPGTSRVTYRLPTGCKTIDVVTVNALPSGITGSATVCEGSMTGLSSSTLGGTWSSSSIATGTVDASGVVTGVAAGNFNITYTLGTGCYRTKTMTVNPLPAAITGIAEACVGNTSTLSSATSGGTWTSANTSIASISSSTGIFTGNSSGNVAISYRLSTGCLITTTVTVDPLPSALSGSMELCLGGTTTLTDADAGGTWMSSNVAIATVDASGVVTGVSLGTSSIIYTLPTGCQGSAVVTVNANPTPITGTLVVCEGSTTDLSSTPGSGVWSSGNTAIATTGPASGAVNGVSAGTVDISYTIGSAGCSAVATVTVNPRPVPIAGSTTVCEAATTTLSDITTGGTWSSGNPLAATVDASGVVTGVDAGTAAVSYTLSTGCAQVVTVSVKPLPLPISGSSSVCEGYNISLTSSPYSTGTWSSSDVTIATVAPTGVVTGVVAGTANLSFTLPTGCYRTEVITVNQTPPAITGAATVCSGSTTTLSNSMAGGTWSASAGAIAVVDASTGVVTGVSSGVAPITYSVSSGCRAIIQVTTYITPPAIGGTGTVCVGETSTVTNTQSGGTWTSADPSIFTVTSTTGIITGVAAGSADVTYTSTSSGCFKTRVITVNPEPASVTGSLSLCVSGTTTLSSSTTGGTWTSSNTSVAQVGFHTGVVNGINAGVANITYRVPTGCTAVVEVTVNALPASITGDLSVCVGSTSTLASTTSGGTWSSSDATVATVDVSSGVVSAVSDGIATIVYTTGAGCTRSRDVTINPVPAAITGVSNICEGSSATLTSPTVGGSWSSSNTAVATTSYGVGTVFGISMGVADISYIIPSSGCYATKTVTIEQTPAVIAGTPNACEGGTSLLSNTTPGGTWTSSVITKATIDATGLVSAIDAGTTTISYTTSNGCKATLVFTVQSVPSPIGGTASVCTGNTTPLTSFPGGGIWSTSNATIATVASTGSVSGIVPGTATISYAFGSGCFVTREVTVNLSPDANTGTTMVCIGGNTTLGNAVPGGTWSSGIPSRATVGATSGTVTGLTAGTVFISYVMPSGCRSVSNITVNALPANITGTANVCVGSTTTLNDGTSGGTWSSSNTSIASIGSGSGVVLGVATGTATATYTSVITGCYRTREVTVNANPAAVSGSGSVCEGSTTTLTDASAGGTWWSGNTGMATVGSTTGLVNGISAGVVNISYKLSTGCYSILPLTVNPTPAAIGGVAKTCVGTTTTLTNTAMGGTWTTSNALVATVDAASGIVTGVTNGTAVITYTLGTTCFTTKLVTVYPLPSPISGTLSMCEGATTHLSSLSPSGSWSSSNTYVATVGATNGIVTGVNSGTATIMYTLSTGCSASVEVTVNSSPTAILGYTNICLGSTTTLTDLTSGGAWSSGNPLVATVDAATGVVTSVTLGTAIMTYQLGTGCRTTTTVTVSVVPADITGIAEVCVGSATNLSDATSGGSWSISDVSIATISTTGVVNGINAGTVTVSYTMPTGCAKTKIVTVNAVPSPITGSLSVCAGANSTLASATTGGVWTSGNPSVATIDVSTGLLTGVSYGTSVITYGFSSGCRVFAVATVNQLPGPITGPISVCEGSSITMHNSVPGGVWSSDFIVYATIEASTGILTGTGTGTDTIRYTMPGGCSTKIVVSVSPAPPAIAGDFDLCAGEVTTFTNTAGGGSWSSSNVSVATIDTGTGVLNALTAGTTTLTYQVGAGCRAVASVVVKPAPTAITGPSEVCVGQTVVLSNGVSGGTWSSTDVSVASVDVSTGVVTGIANNTVSIKYELTGGCFAMFNMTVNSTPPAIGGADSVCQGSTTMLTNLVPGGIWISSNSAVAPIDLMSGVVTGVAPGTARISYTLLGSGCYKDVVVTVNELPAAITGTTNICAGSFTLLSSATVGGNWSSSDMSVAVAGSATGIVTGLGAGTSTVTYTLPTGCIATALVVVNPIPDTIAGVVDICVGSSTTFTNATPYGKWLSSNPAKATIDSATGLVTGMSAGTATISYQLLSTGCYVTKQITINPLPPSISGMPNICIGTTTFLTDLASGGTWSSTDPSVATIDAFGNVSSVSVGTTIISYVLGTACYVTQTVAVEPTLNPITGASDVCEFSTITLSNDYSGGVWTSSDVTIATTGTGGDVTGVAAGSATITYATPLAGCYATKSILVNPIPDVITGTLEVCEGSTTTVANTTASGTWSSTDVSVATIDASGVVTGLAANTVTISYTIATGCAATADVTVNPLPHAGTLSGDAEICLDATGALTSTVSGGIWTSADTNIVKIDSTLGTMTGMGEGTTTLTYTYTNSCGVDSATMDVLVKPLPDAGVLSGVASLCIDYTSALTSTVSGGLWNSSDTAVATVNASGVVTAIVPGTATISYTVVTDCGTDIATIVVTVNVMAPHTDIAVHPNGDLCSTAMYQNFGAATPPATGISYAWSATNADIYATSSDKQNAIVNFPTPGTAVVRLVTSIVNTGCFVTDSVIVNVGSGVAVTPEVKYFGNELICTDNASDSYQWGYDDASTLDSTMIPGAIMQSYYLPVPDFTNRHYWVIAERNGCFQKVYYNAPTGVVVPVVNAIEVVLFPNPADSRINIEVRGLTSLSGISVRLIDMMGKEIQFTELVNGKGSLDVSNLASGMYSVMLVQDGAKIGSRTFVKR